MPHDAGNVLPNVCLASPGQEIQSIALSSPRIQFVTTSQNPFMAPLSFFHLFCQHLLLLSISFLTLNSICERLTKSVHSSLIFFIFFIFYLFLLSISFLIQKQFVATSQNAFLTPSYFQFSGSQVRS